MRSFRSWSMAALLAVVFVAGAGRAPAADSPLAGKYKFKDVSGGNEVTLAIVQFEVKDGKATANNLSSPLLRKGTEFEDARVDDTTVSFSFKAGPNTVSVKVAAAKGEEKPKTLRGSIQVGNGVMFCELERTDLEALTRQEAIKQTPAGRALEKASNADDPKERQAALKEVVEKYGDTTAGYMAAKVLLALRAGDAAKREELRALADGMLKVAKPYGPTVEKQAVLSIAQALTRAEKVSPLAVEFARLAEKGLTKDAPATRSETVLKMLVAALTRTGKADETKDAAASLAKVTQQLDEEYERSAVPFKVEPVAGRSGKSSRVAVVEVFTGAQCPLCVAADIAYDAALRTYTSADVVFLQYHLHIPGPDALTNADNKARAKFYGDDFEGTPSAFVNGKVTPAPGLGGGRDDAKESYDALRKLIDAALETDSVAGLKLTVKRTADRIETEANVTDLKKPGENIRLRFVLVEDVAHYPGSNGLRLHHHVVRAFPGGLEGFPLKDATETQKVLVRLNEVRKGLSDYLDEASKKMATLYDDRPMELKRLKVVALIQDDDTKKILQAAQIDVPEEK